MDALDKLNELLKSEDFKNDLLAAIEKGKYVDYGHKEETFEEFEYDAFDSDVALEAVTNTLTEYFAKK